jgi:hypothetical protein
MMYNTMTKRKEKRQRKNNHLQNTTKKTNSHMLFSAVRVARSLVPEFTHAF